jgi:type I restriction enzyme S subunit
MKVELPTYLCLQALPGSLFGSVPTTWRPSRLKFVMPNVTVGIVITPSKYYVEAGVPAIRSLNVKDGRLTDADLVFFSDEDNRKLAKTRIYIDDIVIVRTGQTGSCAVVDERFNGANCIDLIIVRKSRHLRSKFLQYFLSSGEAAAEIAVSSNGAIQQHFNIGLVREISLLQPSLAEQDAIIAFLDRETAKIDRLMAARRKQVELLQEQRNTVIHHAVTRGLDPDAKFISAVLPWAIQMPKHWVKKRLKFIGRIVLGKMMTNKDAGSMSLRPYLKARNVRWEMVDVTDIDEMWFSSDEMESLRLAKGDLVVTEGGEVGRTALWRAELDECYLQNSVHKITVRAPHEPEYFLYQFHAVGHAGHFDAIVNRVSIAHLTGDKLADVNLLVPPPEEQRSIINHIKRETAKFDTLISKYDRELGFLAEYRASLISHAVTGKIDVRGLVTPTQREAVKTL